MTKKSVGLQKKDDANGEAAVPLSAAENGQASLAGWSYTERRNGKCKALAPRKQGQKADNGMRLQRGECPIKRSSFLFFLRIALSRVL